MVFPFFLWLFLAGLVFACRPQTPSTGAKLKGKLMRPAPEQAGFLVCIGTFISLRAPNLAVCDRARLRICISRLYLGRGKHRCICMIEGKQRLPPGGQQTETDCFRDSVPLSSQETLPRYQTASRGCSIWRWSSLSVCPSRSIQIRLTPLRLSRDVWDSSVVCTHCINTAGHIQGRHLGS